VELTSPDLVRENVHWTVTFKLSKKKKWN
jgi:hypothetical protein